METAIKVIGILSVIFSSLYLLLMFVQLIEFLFRNKRAKREKKHYKQLKKIIKETVSESLKNY